MVSTVRRMPALFIGHGGPSFFTNIPQGTYLSEFSKGSENYHSLVRLPKQVNAENPSAIVIITPHWEGSKVQISASPTSSLFYDYAGFPKELYPAPSNVALSRQISELLLGRGIASELNDKRGWDHGVFVPLKLMYPEANIPVVALSILKTLDPKSHLEIGKALSPLRDQGVVIIGSGAVIHELSNGPENKLFVDAVDQLVTSSPEEREKAFMNWRNIPGAHYAHYREDHLMPLHVVIGAAMSDKGSIPHRHDAFGGAVISTNYCFA